MTYYKSSGTRLGVQAVQTGKSAPRKRRSTSGELETVVHRCAYELMRAAWLDGHWKTSVTTKLPPYLQRLALGGGSTRAPGGVPQGILNAVHRCFAQACLKHEVEGLPGQSLGWYPSAVVAARAQM